MGFFLWMDDGHAFMEVGEDGELTIAQFTSACLMNEDVVHLLRGKEVEGDEQQKQE